MKLNRRDLLKTTAAGGGLAAFAAGYAHTAGKLVEGAWAGEQPHHPIYGNAPAPEFRVDPATGEIEFNPDQGVSYTMCLGCTTLCGVRVRYDKATGKPIRVTGNPYTPLSTDPTVPYETPIRDSFVALSRKDESGLKYRSTACGRGNAVLEQMTSPYRITRPLKRVGPRNGGRWEPISFEQLIEEVVEGGDLFGEGRVEGLRALRDLETPIDPERPDLGPKVNQVVMIDSVNDGRRSFAQRFFKRAYGSLNYGGHGSYCGGAYRSGSGVMFGDHRKMPHAKPDFDNAEFIIFIGTAPANAGNPFKRQGAQLARARSTGALDYVVVDPVLTHSDNLATAERGRWVPIRPGTDGALAMAMIRWILENGRYDANYLAQPSAEAAEAAGEASWSNATHLVIVEEGHPREGRFLRASDLDPAFPEEARGGKDDAFVAIDAETGAPVLHAEANGPAVLFHEAHVLTPRGEVEVATSLALLRREAERLDVAAYSGICGVPEAVIIGLAEKLTSHGKKAAVNTHGGMMAGNGFYNAYSVVMLNTLIGNLNCKGGTYPKAGKHKDDGKGPRYDLAGFPGLVKPRGTPLSRNRRYEESSEYKRKAVEGQPYPAEAPWFPNAPNLAAEWLPALLNGYPYPAQALISWTSNPLYGVAGLRARIEEGLKDPKKLGLIVQIDSFINETGAYADYLVPDSFMYEAWGWAAPWHGVPVKTTTGRWPVVEPMNEKTADGRPITMETFFIEVAKRIGLPGFGPEAIPDADGALHPLERAEDYYLRGGANVAFTGTPVPDASDDDIRLSGVERIRGALKAALKPEEWRKVAYVLARGGRYQPLEQGFEDGRASRPWKAPMLVYNERLGTSRSAITGERFPGTPAWRPAAFADGTPVRAVHTEEEWPFQIISFKSPLQNSYSIGARSLRRIHRENQVVIHAEDAERLGIANGDRVRLTTPGGEGTGRAVVRTGILRGVIAVEHGFGHRELGARPHVIGGEAQPKNPALSAGLNLNELGLSDPTRKGRSVFLDPVSGTAVRQGLPARIEAA